MARPLAERLDAVAASGFSHMSVFPADMKRWWAEGLADADIRRTVETSGVRIATLDPFTPWAPGWSLQGLDEPTRAFIGHTEDDLWRMAEALGTDQVNCVESAGRPYEPEAYADALGRFADRAAAHGLRTTFEFMPISQVPDLTAGWELVERAGDRVSLTFDTWHFWRSDPDHDLLATIPMGRIAEVQVADGAREVQGSLQDDLLHHRRVPGEGNLDLARTLAVLLSSGPVRSVGPETFSDEMNALPAREAVGRNEAGLDAVLRRAAERRQQAVA